MVALGVRGFWRGGVGERCAGGRKGAFLDYRDGSGGWIRWGSFIGLLCGSCSYLTLPSVCLGLYRIYDSRRLPVGIYSLCWSHAFVTFMTARFLTLWSAFSAGRKSTGVYNSSGFLQSVDLPTGELAYLCLLATLLYWPKM